MYTSALDTAAYPELVSCSVYIDEDDLETWETIEAARLPGLTGTIGPRILLSSAWNAAFSNAAGPIYMHCGDDIVFRTDGWDERVRGAFEQFNDGIVFVYGRDGYQPDSFGTHGFLHQRWVDTVGYFLPPHFSSDYNDTWLNEVAKAIGRHVLVDIMTEHMHFIAGKGVKDDVHEDRLRRGAADDVRGLYASLNKARNRDVEKLTRVLKPLSSSAPETSQQATS
jgi:hypothetical protein